MREGPKLLEPRPSYGWLYVCGCLHGSVLHGLVPGTTIEIIWWLVGCLCGPDEGEFAAVAQHVGHIASVHSPAFGPGTMGEVRE